jgi:hypothetical protein
MAISKIYPKSNVRSRHFGANFTQPLSHDLLQREHDNKQKLAIGERKIRRDILQGFLDDHHGETWLDGSDSDNEKLNSETKNVAESIAVIQKQKQSHIERRDYSSSCTESTLRGLRPTPLISYVLDSEATLLMNDLRDEDLCGEEAYTADDPRIKAISEERSNLIQNHFTTTSDLDIYSSKGRNWPSTSQDLSGRRDHNRVTNSAYIIGDLKYADPWPRLQSKRVVGDRKDNINAQSTHQDVGYPGMTMVCNLLLSFV